MTAGAQPIVEIVIDRARPWVTARCPCGGEYTAGHDVRGGAVLLHSLPPCASFHADDPAIFLRKAREGGAELLDGGP
jgi:hypothetical protein